MSAIFGIIDFEGRPIDPEWIKSMQRDLAHRGPDGQGLYQEECMFLGHMLLQVTPESIYDKSPYEEDGLVITAHARLDEREAIMDRLGIPDSERETIVDALLLLRSFKKFGKDFVKDIYGDFAFAIWDKEKKELFCARDQIGVKPFLYYFEDNRFVFSTEIKALVKLSIVKTEIDQIYLIDKALDVWRAPTSTSWKRISRLNSATVLTLSNQKIKKEKYWKPINRRDKKYRSEEDSAKAVKEILERIIADHTRSIQLVGVPLSGGFDSSTIACIAAKKLKKEGKKIVTVSSVLSKNCKEGENDEIEFINSVLKQEENIQANFIFNTELNFDQDLEANLNKHYDLINGFHYLDNAISFKFNSNRVRRVLSGYLGDQTVTNWTINPLPYLLINFKWYKLYKLISEISEKTNISKLNLIKSKVVFEFLPSYLKQFFTKKWGGLDFNTELNKLPLILSNQETKLLNKKLHKSFNLYNFIQNPSNLIWPQDKEHLEEEIDLTSSYYSIETTFPLIDRRLVELLFQIPIEHFIAKGKKRGLIKLSLHEILPKSILNRENKGSYSPGYTKLIQSEIPRIIFELRSRKSSEIYKKSINMKKLISSLKELENKKKITSFGWWDWSLINLIILDKFLTNIDHEKSKKELDKTFN